jgi:mevalonate kinase
MSNRSTEITGTALAGGAIAAALIEALLEKNVLTLAEARNILHRALKTAGIHMPSHEGAEAARIITDLMKGFSARR